MFYFISLLITIAVLAIAISRLAPDGWSSSTIEAKLNSKIRFGILRNFLVLASIAAILSVYSLYLEDASVDRWTLGQLVFVSALAGAVGFGELISRYRDDPKRTLASAPTAIYVSVNVAAGIAALALVKQFHVFKSTGAPIYEVLLAGFGSIAFFRTSFFTARVGTTDVGIGPSTLLKSLLDSSDRMNDREQAVSRADVVANIMKTVDFNKAKASLPALCMMLVETLTQADKDALADQIGKLIRDVSVDENTKSQLLGIYLLKQFGAPVLGQAVTTLGSRIFIGPPGATGPGRTMEAPPPSSGQGDIGRTPDQGVTGPTGPSEPRENEPKGATGASAAVTGGTTDVAGDHEAGEAAGGAATGPTGATGVLQDDAAGAAGDDDAMPSGATGVRGATGEVIIGSTGVTNDEPRPAGDLAGRPSSGATGATDPG